MPSYDAVPYRDNPPFVAVSFERGPTQALFRHDSVVEGPSPPDAQPPLTVQHDVHSRILDVGEPLVWNGPVINIHNFPASIVHHLKEFIGCSVGREKYPDGPSTVHFQPVFFVGAVNEVAEYPSQYKPPHAIQTPLNHYLSQ